jgi:hypothetical protein
MSMRPLAKSLSSLTQAEASPPLGAVLAARFSPSVRNVVAGTASLI